MTRGKRSFGEVSKLPSGRYRARYRELNGHRVSAPNTFATRGRSGPVAYPQASRAAQGGLDRHGHRDA